MRDTKVTLTGELVGELKRPTCKNRIWGRYPEGVSAKGPFSYTR